mgnify:CR=1 FL=1
MFYRWKKRGWDGNKSKITIGDRRVRGRKGNKARKVEGHQRRRRRRRLRKGVGQRYGNVWGNMTGQIRKGRLEGGVQQRSREKTIERC